MSEHCVLSKYCSHVLPVALQLSCMNMILLMVYHSYGLGCSHDDLDALDPIANLPHSGMMELCLARQPYLVSTVSCLDLKVSYSCCHMLLLCI